jgi:predicted nucleic acid-binding protein
LSSWAKATKSTTGPTRASRNGHPERQARQPLLDLLAYGTMLPDPEVQPAITRDPDDDKFLLCARDAAAIIVSGDRHLPDVSGWGGVHVLTPRAFLDQPLLKGQITHRR